MRLTLVLLMLSSCGSSKPAAETAYTAELLQCVDKAKTATEAETCRKGVNAKWNLVDAGGQ
jgi:hypothetical protein